jgi:excisionase family DNA binding protein
MDRNKSRARLSQVNGGGRRYAKIREAADYLGVQPITIRAMIADGRLTGYRGLGSRVLRIDLNEIDAQMDTDECERA